jgi:hypothetical protein
MSSYWKYAILACSYLLFCNPFGYCAQAGGGAIVKDSAARFRLARVIIGSKGSQKNGGFVIEDPRSVFNISQDRQVIVYFEMEGPLGMHRIEGFWKNPSGKVVTLSDFNYESKEKRFSAYCTLALLDSAETGTWSLEARVDGEHVGALSFQILSGDSPTPNKLSKKPLLPAEMYRRLSASTVMIETINSYGEVLSLGSGFIAGTDLLITSYRAVDGASKIRARFSDNRMLETDRIIAWNMDRDWVAIPISTETLAPIPLAENNTWDIGDTVSYLDFSPTGTQVISESSIVGKNAPATSGERLSLSNTANEKAVGGPILNQYGEVIAIMGNPNTGIYRANPIVFAAAGGIRNQVAARSSLAIPASLLAPKQSNATDMKTLNRHKQAFPPLTAGKHLRYIQLTHRADKSTGRAIPMDSSNVFARRDAQMGVFVMWDPKEAIKTSASFQVFDANNTAVTVPGKFKETKLNLRPSQTMSSYWEWKVSDMAVGLYRIDILLNNEPAGRAFFKID